MRHISRALSKAPAILLGQDAQQWFDEVMKYFMLSPDRRATRRAPDASHLYGHDDVYVALSSAQKDKCAFCETPLGRGAKMDHFRPLSNASMSRKHDGSTDHYAWFATEWRNLMLVCPVCYSAKRNLFPVRGERCEPLARWETVTSERPLIINPFTVRPERHMAFRADGVVEPLSDAGDATIRILRLNRASVNAGRQGAIGEAMQTMHSDRPDPDGLRRLLRPAAPYAGAVAAHLYAFATAEGIFLPPGRDLAWQLIKGLQGLGRGRRPRVSENRRISGDPVRVPVQEREPPTSTDVAITGVHIRNVKGISRLRLALPPPVRRGATSCLMLLGENATGKSSVLQALAISLMSEAQRQAISLVRRDFQTRESHDWDTAIAINPGVTVDLAGGGSSRWEWVSDDRFVRGGVAPPQVWGYGAHRRVAESASELSSIGSIFNADVALPDPSKWLSTIDDHRFNAAARALRIVLDLQRDDEIFRDLTGRVMVKAHGRIAPLAQLSDGYRSLLAMIVDIMRSVMRTRSDLEYASGIVLIDEIEVHLHPRWKMRVVPALREAFPGLQFILTTHDPLCLRGMGKDEVKVIYRDSTGEVRLVEDLPDVSRLRVDQLLTSDLFGLNSATDPEMDRVTEELALLSAIPLERMTDNQRARRDVLLQAFPGTDVIGSDVGRQVAAEALTRHLAGYEQRDLALRADARKESVRRLLAIFNNEG